MNGISNCVKNCVKSCLRCYVKRGLTRSYKDMKKEVFGRRRFYDQCLDEGIKPSDNLLGEDYEGACLYVNGLIEATRDASDSGLIKEDDSIAIIAGLLELCEQAQEMKKEYTAKFAFAEEH